MQTDKYTKVVLTLIAIGLFLNAAMYLRVTPAGAASKVLEADVVRTKMLELTDAYGTRKTVIIPGVITLKEASSLWRADEAAYDNHFTISSGGMEMSDDENPLGFMAGVSEKGGGYMYFNKGKNPLRKMISINGANENGGSIKVLNKTGEEVVTLGVDEYGNGQVGAWNRKGVGRTLEPR